MRGGVHWREGLIEAGLVGLFMVVACALGVLLEHPGSPAVSLVGDPFARRLLFGVAMGATATAIVYSPAGMRSGAHLNPAGTLAYLRLGKVKPADAAAYVLAQVAGALVGVLAAWRLLGPRLAHPAVHFVTTRPGPAGVLAAFGAEVGIAFLLMSVVLAVSASRWKAWTGVCAGTLVALYITFEAPISGMSLNPARTLGSALPAGELGTLWIYFLAPPLGMLAAAAAMRRRSARACAKLHHPDDVPCIFCGQGSPSARRPRGAPPAARGVPRARAVDVRARDGRAPAHPPLLAGPARAARASRRGRFVTIPPPPTLPSSRRG
jgi:aquaporin Z